VAILDHGKLVFAGTVDEINRADCEYQLSLSRELQDEEWEQITALAGIRRLKAAGGTSMNSSDYIVTLDLDDSTLDQDAILAALLQTLLEINAIPRTLSRGRSLEKHFLEVTGAGNST
jgi:hypothetical protein